MADLFQDTIFSLSSGRLPAGIAVVRISGASVRFVVETVFGELPEPRSARFGAICNSSGGVIDYGLVIYFPGPRSFTGEECAEFHLHGGKAVVVAFLRELGAIEGVRQAEPGEFSRRAFLNGKFDLTEAEALADLVTAETESQRLLALENAQGSQRKLYQAWNIRLLRTRALIEAELDFNDEADIPISVSREVWADLANLKAEMLLHLDAFSRAEIIRDGFRVVILGAPNSGKSSLLNALANRDAAIVSDEPGTTRDLIEVQLDLYGNLVIITDTAGIRAASGSIEAMGIDRALERARRAHLILVIEDSFAPVEVVLPNVATPVLRVGSKSDLGHVKGRYDLVLSALSGNGIDQLSRIIAEKACDAIGGLVDATPSRLRHVEHLAVCETELGRALDGVDDPLELRAEHLRQAANSLGRITGTVDVEDLLAAIFSEFCIGK